MRGPTTPLLVVLLTVALVGCAPDATYEEKTAYLEKVRTRGADAHAEFVRQGVQPDEDRCRKRSNAVNTDYPDALNVSFYREVERTFVAACRSGKR